MKVLALLMLALAGCAVPAEPAPARFAGLCALQGVGTTDSGITVARVYCEPMK